MLVSEVVDSGRTGPHGGEAVDIRGLRGPGHGPMLEACGALRSQLFAQGGGVGGSQRRLL